MSQRRIVPLSAADVHHLRSSVVTTTLVDVALGLVRNSLDAASSRITLQIDFPKGGCEVEDDGQGIPSEDFRDEGGLLKQYWTSKSDDTIAHGHNGCFLTSVASMSSLELVSRTENAERPSVLQARYAKVLVGESVSHSSASGFSGQGTRVRVSNLFGNMPVRVKQRSLMAESGESTRQWAHLTRECVALLLAWPRRISLHLRDENGVSKLVVRSSDGLEKTEIPDGLQTTLFERILSVLTQARIIEPTSRPAWVPVSASSSSITVRGAISLDPAASKHAQFISFGITPLATHDSSSEIHRVINGTFASSRFGVEEVATPDEAETERRRKDRRFKQDGFTDKQLFGGRKGIDRWPMFYINVTFKGQSADVRRQRERLSALVSVEDPLINRLINLIGKMVTAWLAEHHFRPPRWREREISHKTPTQPGSSDVNSRPGSSTFLASLTRIATPSGADSPTTGQRSRMTTNDGGALSGAGLGCESLAEGCNDNESFFTWVHPITKEKHQIDKQSGAIIPANETSQLIHETPCMRNNNRAEPRHSLRLEVRQAIGEIQPRAEWITSVLQHWDNPVFARSEPAMQQVDLRVLEDGLRSDGRSHRHCSVRSMPHQPAVEIQMSIKDLRGADVVSQLDGKFLLVKVSSVAHIQTNKAKKDSPAELLVMVDQHAADERIKVEDLYHGLCADRELVTLQKPLYFTVSAREQPLFEAQLEYFARWGISYTMSATDQRGNKITSAVNVKTLPVGIAERCTEQPKHLIDMLRSEIWSAKEHAGSWLQSEHITPDVKSERHRWLGDITKCPSGIVEMLKSRACRSAVMFNDHLSLQEGKELILKLADCALPFQCAHGRPSVVPIVNMGTLPFSGNDEASAHSNVSEGASTDTAFSRAYKQWTAG